MQGLERLVRFEDGSLMTWGTDRVLDATLDAGRKVSLRWRVNPDLRASQLGPEMHLIDRDETWGLRAYQDEGTPMTATRLVDGKVVASGTIRARFKPTDVSVAVMDRTWIYLPDSPGGLLRIRKRDIR